MEDGIAVIFSGIADSEFVLSDCIGGIDGEIWDIDEKWVSLLIIAIKTTNIKRINKNVDPHAIARIPNVVLFRAFFFEGFEEGSNCRKFGVENLFEVAVTRVFSIVFVLLKNSIFLNAFSRLVLTLLSFGLRFSELS